MILAGRQTGPSFSVTNDVEKGSIHVHTCIHTHTHRYTHTHIMLTHGHAQTLLLFYKMVTHFSVWALSMPWEIPSAFNLGKQV